MVRSCIGVEPLWSGPVQEKNPSGQVLYRSKPLCGQVLFRSRTPPVSSCAEIEPLYGQVLYRGRIPLLSVPVQW